MRGRVWFDDRRDHWVAILELGQDGQGKRRTASKGGFAKKREAESYLVEKLHELEEGTYVVTNTITLAEWCERWLRDYAPLHISDTTLSYYKGIVKNHIIPELGAVKLQRLDKPTVQSAITKWSKEMQASSCRLITTILKAILKEAVESGIIRRNPAQSVILPKLQRKEMRALDEVEAVELLKKLEGSKLYLPTLLAVSTGMRRGEILGLKWSAIEGNVATITETIAQNGTVHPPKTERGRRSVTLPAVVMAALKDHRKRQVEDRLAAGASWTETGYILTKVDGRPWTASDLSSTFTRAMQGFGIKLRFHDLRHTHASQLLRAGFPVNLVAERLGHDAGETLRTYSHIMPGQDALAAEKMDDMLAAVK